VNFKQSKDMGPTITFGGVGSGMDIEGLIEGLVGVSRQPITRLQNRAASARAAVTELSDIGSLLSKLKTAAGNLDTVQEVGSFKASASNENAVALSASGLAQPGSYEVQVLQLASAERRYSNGMASSNSALGHQGTLTLQLGTEDVDIAVEATDTLDSLIKKINDSGLRVAASSFFDGNEYRLQIRGLDAGAENALTLAQSGFDLGLQEEANIVTQAQNARVTIDGFLVESSSNNINQAIPGLSLALKQTTSETFQVNIADDPEALGAKVKGFVDAYNAVINKVHQTAGFGTIKASNSALAGDSSLRGITSQLSSQLSRSFGSGAFTTLASLGVQLNNNGTLKLDQSKLSNAIATDPRAVTDILAGRDDVAGFMDQMTELTDRLTDPNKGSLSIRKDGFDARARRFDDQIETEQKRLEALESRLRKTFSQMDATVAGYNAQLNYLLANS